jgi:hypothetical protein
MEDDLDNKEEKKIFPWIMLSSQQNDWVQTSYCLNRTKDFLIYILRENYQGFRLWTL